MWTKVSVLREKTTTCKRIWLIHMLAVWLGCYHQVTQCEHQGADCADADCPLMCWEGWVAGFRCNSAKYRHGPSQDLIIFMVLWDLNEWRSVETLIESVTACVCELSAGGPVQTCHFSSSWSALAVTLIDDETMERCKFAAVSLLIFFRGRHKNQLAVVCLTRLQERELRLHFVRLNAA